MDAVHFADEIKEYLEETIGIPCLRKENRPCDLMFPPAVLGYPYAKQCRLSVMSDSVWPKVLLIIRHDDRLLGNHAMLHQVCSFLQRTLDCEAPNAMITIADDGCMQLTLTALVDRASDVAGMILHAFRLLSKYEYTMREEICLMPEDEGGWYDEEPCEELPTEYTPPDKREYLLEHPIIEEDEEEGDEEDEFVF